MTHTSEITAQGINGDQRYVQAVVDITSYTSGGEVLTELIDLFSRIDFMMVQPVKGTTAYLVGVEKATGKVKLSTATGTEVTTGWPTADLEVQILGR